MQAGGLMLDWLTNATEGLITFLSGYGFIYSPLYLLTSFAIAALYWAVAKPGGRLLGYIFPKDVYTHPSHKADISIASVNVLFVGLGGFSFIVLTPLFAGSVVLTLTDPIALSESAELTFGWAIALVILLVLAEDLARYLVHRGHHVIPLIWPFHAVHHSAQVMTPLTFFRAHPAYYFFQRILISMLTGTAQGLIVALAFGWAPGWVFFAAVIASRAYMALGVHLRHSHIPLGYGRFLEHILISPRLHQVHHSIERRHFDRNFGEIFALWDWLFGTLYIPEKGERIQFGLTDSEGQIVQPYPNLRQAMVKPFAESAEVLRGKKANNDRTAERA